MIYLKVIEGDLEGSSEQLQKLLALKAADGRIEKAHVARHRERG